MKQRVTLLVLATLMLVASSFAQQKAPQQTLSKQKMEALVKQQPRKAVKQQEARKLLQMQQNTERQQARRATIVSHKKAGVKATRRANRAMDIISEQPAGQKVGYSRSGKAYYASLFGVGSTELNGALGTVVFGDNNKVYIKDIVSQAGLGTWVEGTISGNKITIELPQQLGYNYSYGYGFQAAVVEYDAAEGWYVKSANQTVTLNYDAATGEISTPAGKLQTGEELIGIIYDDDESWSGYGDWNLTFSAVTDPLVEAPAGLQTELYALTSEGYEGSLVKVGFDGNDVYVQGIDKNLPETWVKGTVEGDKVVFKNGQYIGADEVAGYHQYLMSATAEEKYDADYDEYYTEYTLSDGDITFNYDATTKTLSASTLFLLNAGKDKVNYLYAFKSANIKPFQEVAATPATPVINKLFEGGWDYFASGYGWGYIDFDLQASDVDGNYIMPEKLSYQLYTKVNGEVKPMTISPEDFIYLEETMTEIPYGFQDGWDIYANGTTQTVYYHVVGPEAYGVQAIYRGAGEERRSEIAWAEVYDLGAEVQPDAATPAYPDVTLSATDNRIGYGFYTGEEQVSTVTNNSKAETYDVAIHLNDAAMVGTAIESITFPLQTTEGVSDLQVFLTSQLRVENGKNAADLAVKAVTPTEAGFVTVTLDKPYLIPEGGVYVGYSLTVNDASSEENAQPIAIISQQNEGGFYLHTSDGFLKWLDVTEGFGGSSLIQVQLAGSAIKANAVAVNDVAQQYVKTGEAISIPVTVVNHGAKGIQSFDVIYNVAGQDGSQHVDATVDGFFGKSTSFNLNIPAIAEKGNYELVVKVDKVNGVNNEDAYSSATIPVVALNSVPKKRTLLEEYTGFWCGYCPRGYVGLEKLAELYPDDFVLISYHNGDELEIMPSSNFPSPVAGFPDAWMDRTTEVDAYYGSGNKEFGIADDMAASNKQFGQADIALSSKLNQRSSTLNIDAQVVFPYNLTDGDFAVEYVLTADGLKDAAWGQSNYYANGSMGTPLYMDTFTNTSDGTVYGLTFNDVAVITSEMLGGSGQTITTASDGTPVQLQYAFDLSQVLNTSSAPIIQNTENLKVVVLLIDKSTGAVVNANKAKIGTTTGISIVEVRNNSTENVCYDLAGRRIAQPAKGLYIVNGRKVVVK